MTKKNEIQDAKIINAIRQMVEVMQIKVKNNLVEKSKDIKVTRDELVVITQIIDASLMNIFSESVENIVKEIKS